MAKKNPKRFVVGEPDSPKTIYGETWDREDFMGTLTLEQAEDRKKRMRNKLLVILELVEYKPEKD